MKLRIPYWPIALGPYILYATGFAFNAIAMGVNHAQMPVLAGYNPYDAIGGPMDTAHVAMAYSTHLKFLCDWIVLNGLGTASPGDLLILAFWNTYVYAAVAWITLVLKDAQKVLTSKPKCDILNVPSEKPEETCSTRKRRKT